MFSYSFQPQASVLTLEFIYMKPLNLMHLASNSNHTIENFKTKTASRGSEKFSSVEPSCRYAEALNDKLSNSECRLLQMTGILFTRTKSIISKRCYS